VTVVWNPQIWYQTLEKRRNRDLIGRKENEEKCERKLSGKRINN
jgi:hypothetical protein